MARTERLEDRTREELYELAQEREIAGRSSMTKRELVRALAGTMDGKASRREASESEAPGRDMPSPADEDADDADALDRSPTSGRAVWSGHISFGLVTIPVGLYTAVEDRSISFHLVDERDGARIRYRKVNEQTGDEVSTEHIVKGYPVGAGQHVIFTDDELERIPSDSVRTIEVAQFVERRELDPKLLDRSYFVAPREGGARAYAVLMAAMQANKVLAIAKVTLRQREHLAALRADDSVLALETLHWPDEIRVPAFETAGEGQATNEEQVAMAEQLIEHMRSPFDPSRYRDSYRERLEEAIEAKLAGEEIRLAPDEPEGAEVVDLTEVLRRSVEGARSRKSA